jgi:hypothetical protein
LGTFSFESEPIKKEENFCHNSKENVKKTQTTVNLQSSLRDKKQGNMIDILKTNTFENLYPSDFTLFNSNKTLTKTSLGSKNINIITPEPLTFADNCCFLFKIDKTMTKIFQFGIAFYKPGMTAEIYFELSNKKSTEIKDGDLITVNLNLCDKKIIIFNNGKIQRTRKHYYLPDADNIQSIKLFVKVQDKGDTITLL